MGHKDLAFDHLQAKRFIQAAGRELHSPDLPLEIRIETKSEGSPKILIISDTGIDTNDMSKTTYGRVNTTFGGSLVDADLRRPGGGNAHGNDQLAELLPGFLFTVINPTKL